MFLCVRSIQEQNFGDDEKYEILKDSRYSEAAVLTADVSLSYYNMKHFKTTGVVSSTKDRLFLLPFCIYFRKHSCLANPISDLINIYTSSGLLEYWISLYHQKRFVIIKAEDLEGDQSPQRLNLKQLLGGFIISSILLVAAFIVFLFEVMSKKCQFLNNFLKF